MILLGMQLLNKGDATNAERLFQQGIAIERRLKTPVTRSLYYGLFCLGELNVRRGDYAKAKPLLEEAFALSAKQRGENNEDSAYILVSMGRAKEFAGDLNGAETAYRKSIEIFRQLPQRYEVRMAIALANLGNVLSDERRYDEAIEVLSESERIAQKAGDSIYLLVAKAYLGSAYFEKGDYNKAIEKGKIAVGIGRKIKLEGFSSYCEALTYLGVGLTRTNQPREGEPYLREALDIRRKTPKSYLVSESQSALGECLTAQKRFAEAEPLLTRGYNDLKLKLGEKDQRVVEARKRLGSLYKAWDKAPPNP